MNNITNDTENYQFRISQISHEIRNPVTLINSYLQLFAKAHPEVTDFEYWDHITSNMDYLIVLLNEISSLNRSLSVKTEYLNIYRFLQDFTETVEIELKKQNIKIQLLKESALPRLSFDPVKLKEVLFNLVRNAAEAIHQDGRITIRTYFEDLSIVIVITDDGPGIPKDHLDTIFDPFVTYKKDGTGLGLAITKNIIDAHNGTIQAISGIGEGTSFIITLPL